MHFLVTSIVYLIGVVKDIIKIDFLFIFLVICIYCIDHMMQQDNHNEEDNSCPICMEMVVRDINCVVTECKHCFHSSCLMRHISYNGFICPYCRKCLAEEPVNSVCADTSSEVSYIGLRGLFTLPIEGLLSEDLDNDNTTNEHLEIEYPEITVEQMTQHLFNSEFTVEELVAVLMYSNSETTTDEEELLTERLYNCMNQALFTGQLLLDNSLVPSYTSNET